jgi:hypothetical protein
MYSLFLPHFPPITTAVLFNEILADDQAKFCAGFALGALTADIFVQAEDLFQFQILLFHFLLSWLALYH